MAYINTSRAFSNTPRGLNSLKAGTDWLIKSFFVMTRATVPLSCEFCFDVEGFSHCIQPRDSRIGRIHKKKDEQNPPKKILPRTGSETFVSFV